MELKGKALFNLLKIQSEETPASEVKPWQIEDLESLSITELFSRLKKLGLILDEQSFSLYAENVESPEELTECIWCEEEITEGYDQVYLIVFELWKRLEKEKFCLSIFCDELDKLIYLYDRGELQEEERLQKALGLLEDILDTAFDQTKDASAVFSEVASYSAHDLEHFLTDYISDQIAGGQTTYASELIDAFYPYVKKRSFDLLRASLLAESDLEASNRMYTRILEELLESRDVESTLQVVEGLIHHGHVRLFTQAAAQALELVKVEEEVQLLLMLIAEYYRCLDRQESQEKIEALLAERLSFEKTRTLSKEDPLFPLVRSVLGL